MFLSNGEISAISKPLLEFGLVQPTWVWNTFLSTLRLGQEDVPPAAAAYSSDTDLCVEECVSCLSLWQWAVLFVDPLFFLCLCRAPTALWKERQSVRTSLEFPDRCAEYTTHKPPDILTISLGAPHSWPPLACAYLGQRSTPAAPAGMIHAAAHLQHTFSVFDSWSKWGKRADAHQRKWT